MRKPAHHLMAYNTQIAVDGKYKFIVATDISTKGTDFIEKIENETKAYHWSIVEPVLEIKTLRKNNIVEYSLETLKEWMSEL